MENHGKGNISYYQKYLGNSAIGMQACGIRLMKHTKNRHIVWENVRWGQEVRAQNKVRWTVKAIDHCILTMIITWQPYISKDWLNTQ